MRSASYFAGESLGGGPLQVRDGIVVPHAGNGNRISRALPLAIYWPGAIVNTLIYAAVLLALATLVRLSRQRLRVRRGHCPACNYDLRATTTGVCPECGAVIYSLSSVA
ncbi:MAG: hypothetical protein IT430_03595 [Phycisphaerales bacterium]|nr:hypothetical protein [Phycisphaerales bacterium]